MKGRHMALVLVHVRELGAVQVSGVAESQRHVALVQVRGGGLRSSEGDAGEGSSWV